ncbi:hypothetical protein [Halorientalis halophila]|uniref:hypothetical protein n=1 Tax=Halorientalis halophila TaxID=3108499 RepID=UPI00300B47DD
MQRSDATEIWLDRFARRLGCGWLADRLPGDLPPSYVYAIVTVGLLSIAHTTWKYFAGYPMTYVRNPYMLAQPVVLFAAVYGSRRLTMRARRALDEMAVAERASDPDALYDVVPEWLPWLFFVVGAVFGLVRAVVAVGLPTIVETTGYPGLVAWLVINPFVFTPIGAQFLAVYLSVEVRLPWRLSRSDVGIDFLDPEGLGGLRPVGELVKHAYYYLAVGLVAFALVLYSPFVDTPLYGATAFTGAVFTAAWVVTIASVAFAVLVLHRFMHREKRAELRRLTALVNDSVEDRWDVAAFSIPDERREEVERLRHRMDMVSATNEYPATFNIWSQLLLSIAIPKAVQLLLAGL